MTSRRTFLVTALVGCLWFFQSPQPHADRLHLDGGGSIETANWWVDQDTLYYETAAGTVGVPRGSVLRIEKTAASPAEAQNATSPESGMKTRTRGIESKSAIKQLEAGIAALQLQQFEQAASFFGEALNRSPDLIEARIGYALAKMRAGHDGQALSVILEGVSRHPDTARLHEILGDLRDREERMEDARQEWRRAFKLDPNERVREKIERAERELASRRDFAFATTPHFNVRYDDNSDGPLAREVIKALETDWWLVTDRLDHEPLQPINVLVYSKVQFQSLTRAPADVAGLFDGKIRVPLGSLERLTADARRVLRHELTHAVLHSKTRGNCPRWLHEGLAQILDGTQLTSHARETLAAALSTSEPQSFVEENFSYPAALSFNEWIISVYGFDDLLNLLDELSDGRPWLRAVEDDWRISWPALLERWATDTRAEFE